MTLRLRSIVVGESAAPWEAAGFSVVDDVVALGALSVVCAGDGLTSSRWGLDGAGDLATVDGITVVPAALGGVGVRARAPEQRGHGASRMGSDTVRDGHRNRVVDIDHVVVRSPDLDRTTAMFENQGIECRRIRDVPLGDTPMQQRFFRIPTGEDTSTIIELVGPAEPSGGGPATIWGLACVVDDIDTAVATLGDACSEARDAVQPGRRIATIRTGDVGIHLTLALMTPR